MNREQVLDNWLRLILKTAHFKRVSLAGDASFRRYYRISLKDCQYVVMDAPPPESPALFVNIADVLDKQGLKVPKVLAMEMKEGFLLLSDLGDRLYLNELNDNTVDTLYKDALQAMLKFQFCLTTPNLPAFDLSFFQRQLDIFEEWYLKKHLAVSITDQMSEILMPIYEQLFQVIKEQPQVFVHRDYHSRNLMILENNNPGILDFQDAMIGPITYDLVSLLQDCYIAWPRARVVEWVFEFFREAKKQGLLNKEKSQSEFLRWFDLTGLQRHLKNLGIFSRLYYRDNKIGYLKDIPQLLNYITETTKHYAELHSLFLFFESLPKIDESKIKCAQ